MLNTMFTLLYEEVSQSSGEIKKREVSWTLTKKPIICRSRRGQEDGGGAGPPREPRRDQEQGGGAGLRKLDLSFASVVPQ